MLLLWNGVEKIDQFKIFKGYDSCEYYGDYILDLLYKNCRNWSLQLRVFYIIDVQLRHIKYQLRELNHSNSSMENANLEKGIIQISGLEGAWCGFGDKYDQIRKFRKLIGNLSSHTYEKSVILQVGF